MNRAPLINIPKEKKKPKPIRRKPEERTRYRCETFKAADPKVRKRIKAVGKRGTQKRQDKKKALNLYFQNHGQVGEDGWVAKCQLTGMICRREEIHPCHKKRASAQGGEAPENIVAGHWRAHRWLDALGSRSDRETHLRASPVNCATGGVVDWPEELKASLHKAMGWKK